MGYLKLKRCQITLACFLIAAFVLWAFPGIDILISRLFFDEGFYLRDSGWPVVLQRGVGYYLALSMASVVGVYLVNRGFGRNIWDIDGRKVSYLFLVLIVGAGLIVNVVLKDNFGRARPRDIAEFGGSRQFTPPFVISHECNTNCSFTSGDGAAAFFSLALAMALRKRRALFVAGASFGVLVSLSRVAVGAHFFSDIVVSFFVMWILADVLYHYMFLPDAEREHAASMPARARVS